MISYTEENYLKAIFKIVERENKAAGTNAIAHEMETSAASVTDMLKRLAEKKLINYQKYKGVNLTNSGAKLATNLIRKHRLWETFLVDKLGFSWDKVHNIAEELEHIKSEELVSSLDKYLNHPKFDPHGDPIPNAEGKFTLRAQIPLSKLRKGEAGLVIGVKEHEDEFLRFLSKKGISIGEEIRILDSFSYDNSMTILIAGEKHLITSKVSQQILVKKV